MLKTVIRKYFFIEKPLQVGRWMPKNDVEKWMMNYHPEPGYINNFKKEWLEKIKKSN